MGIGHQYIIITDNRPAITIHRAPVDGDIFPNLVIIADDQLCGFPLVMHILRRGTDRGKGADMIASPYGRMAGNNCVGSHICFSTNGDIFLHNSIRTNGSSFVNFCLRFNHGSGVYGHLLYPLRAVFPQ